ncbi:MAG: hypothetical protein J0L62_00975 [Bacteroidetes bacterium]|nr:hypothetical protein [Bacteroidota bacterium]
MSYSFLIFSVFNSKFAISSEQIYRIERFDVENVEYKDSHPSFYRVGDYVISLDWLTDSEINFDDPANFSRLILYRSSTKIRGIPVTDLHKVESFYDVSKISSVPKFFRGRPVLNWVHAFITANGQIIPILNLETLASLNLSAQVSQ